MAASTAHDCPAKGCKRRVARHQLMCRLHWYMVPKPLRDAVYAAYGNGLRAGTPAHRDAILAAVEAVNAKLRHAVAVEEERLDAADIAADRRERLDID